MLFLVPTFISGSSSLITSISGSGSFFKNKRQVEKIGRQQANNRECFSANLQQVIQLFPLVIIQLICLFIYLSILINKVKVDRSPSEDHTTPSSLPPLLSSFQPLLTALSSPPPSRKLASILFKQLTHLQQGLVDHLLDLLVLVHKVRDHFPHRQHRPLRYFCCVN